MTIQMSITHSLQAFMSMSNGQSNSNKGAVYIKAQDCNALSVGLKCRDLISFKGKAAIKERKRGTKRYTQKLDPKTTPKWNPFSKLFF